MSGYKHKYKVQKPSTKFLDLRVASTSTLERKLLVPAKLLINQFISFSGDKK